ncbi:MAG TPA: gluconate 2-dehydrogenase subunit 3 family protein [Terriglobia bacterium]|nr:gluconate 2-dehydrogenase subunit 3 family protein [Terriglobia bacterium]
MTKRIEDEANQGRRGVLKTLVMGAGGLTTLPILGQAEPASTPMSRMNMSADVDATAQTGANWKPQFFDAHQNETLIALTDLIIPATDTPGAKAALVNRYVDLRYNEESAENQQNLIQALAWFDGRSLTLHNKPFVSLTEAQQTALLNPLADPEKARPEDEAGVKAFGLIKNLTIFGYYTSKIGLDEELQYQGDTYNTSFPGACTHPEHQS